MKVSKKKVEIALATNCMQQVFPELKCSLEVGMTRASNADAFAEFGRDGE